MFLIQFTERIPWLKRYKGRLAEDKWNDGSAFTINGQRFSTGISTKLFDDKIEVTYKLEGKYSSLKFKYGMDDTSTDFGNITIFGDENIIFDSGKMDRMEDPKLATVNIKDYKFIKIQFNSEALNENSMAGPTLADPVLIP